MLNLGGCTAKEFERLKDGIYKSGALLVINRDITPIHGVTWSDMGPYL